MTRKPAVFKNSLPTRSRKARSKTRAFQFDKKAVGITPLFFLFVFLDIYLYNKEKEMLLRMPNKYRDGTKQFTLRFPEALREKLFAKAKERNIPVSVFIRMAIQKEVNKDS